MRVGILKEIKAAENRVCMTPAGVEVMVKNGHALMVEAEAGVGSGFEDSDYLAAGAIIVDDPEDIFAKCDMVMHVKEPQKSEYKLIRSGQIVFTYLHLAADEVLTRAMIETGCVGIAYETVQKADGSLPLLTPMSEVAGRMATQQAARFLEMPQGGLGCLMGGVPGVDPATVVVIGGGVVGINAAKMACGLGAKVYILDTNLDRLRHLSEVMPANCITMMSNPANVRRLAREADAVIGAVLVAGAKAPHLLKRDDLKLMKLGAVIVDVAIDQGGCFETSKPTTHIKPVYYVDNVLHYCVANIPGAVPKTSTLALTNATLPYALEIANKGWMQSAKSNPEIKAGINVLCENVVYLAVADAFGLKHLNVEDFID